MPYCLPPSISAIGESPIIITFSFGGLPSVLKQKSKNSTKLDSELFATKLTELSAFMDFPLNLPKAEDLKNKGKGEKEWNLI